LLPFQVTFPELFYYTFQALLSPISTPHLSNNTLQHVSRPCNYHDSPLAKQSIYFTPKPTQATTPAAIRSSGKLIYPILRLLFTQQTALPMALAGFTIPFSHTPSSLTTHPESKLNGSVTTDGALIGFGAGTAHL